MMVSLRVMNAYKALFCTIACFVLAASSAKAESPAAVDSKALIQEIRNNYQRQYAMMHTLSFEVFTREGKIKDSQFVEESTTQRLLAYRFLGDSIIKAERYLSGTVEGVAVDEKGLAKMVDKRDEAAKKREKNRKQGDIAFSPYKPFLASHEAVYSITYDGTATPKNHDILCHRFTVKSNEVSDSTVNGTFYFDAASMRLLRTEFSPSKIPKGAMFNMKELTMALDYTPLNDSIWMPTEFRLQGRAKAMMFIGVNFAIEESYRNPVINDPATDTLFVKKP